MGEKSKRLKENVSGFFYVDSKCSGCGVCTTDAPNNFKMNEDNSFAFVCKQPEDEREHEECNNALLVCPASSIGNDG